MKSFRICIQNIRKWTSNSRIWMSLVLAMLFVYLYTKGLWSVCDYLQEDMSPWIFPFLLTYRYMNIIFMFPVVFIFCDAPFIDANQPYVMLRTKRSIWSIGQVLYIMLGSFAYVLVLFLSTIIVNIGHLTWNPSWGNVLGLAGTSNILEILRVNYSTVKLPGKVIQHFTPLQAIFFSALLMWLSFVFIGLIIYVFNVVTNTTVVGVVIASFFILFTSLADLDIRLVKFSPISWNNLANIDVGGISNYPTIDFVLGFYIITNIVLAVIAVLVGKRQNVEVHMVT